jgi:hypothetical protein
MNILLKGISLINSTNITDLLDNLDILEEMMSVITMAVEVLDRLNKAVLLRVYDR